MYYRWAVSCCRSWRSTLSAVLTPGCSVRGSTSTVSCPTPSPRPGHSRSCTCSAGPRPSCHRRCTAYWGESWTTKGNQLIVQHFVTCYVIFNRTYSIVFCKQEGSVGLGWQTYPNILTKNNIKITKGKFSFSCWTFSYERLEWIFDAPNVLFLFVSRILIMW